MLFIVKQVLTLIKLLHSENGSNQIAAALVLGLGLALLPLYSLFGILILLSALFLRVQLAAFFFSALIFSFLSLLIYPYLSHLGYFVLTQESLRELFALLQSNSIVYFSRFYNSGVMGALIFYTLAAVPIYFILKKMIRGYRSYVTQKLKPLARASWIVNLYKLYEKYDVL